MSKPFTPANKSILLNPPIENTVVHDLRTVISDSMVKKKTKIRTLNDIKGLNIDKILHTYNNPEKQPTQC